MFDGGRKLSVGDCALFQAGNAPPFIGILRRLTQEKDSTKFGVNWLYRPADVKLAKGGPLEAAPNEIFYSFHKDEISAASLLHPCKVAFLRKGIELPPGVSSFVCRRVYDTANKCLWWLTDRDYTDEHQDEVDQLLDRTKLEMQAAVQSGGPSPRAVIGGPTSSQQQLKSSSEGAQNATYSAPIKSSKKRERADQNLEPSKRERSVKTEDGDLSPLKRERSMKPEEVASITDKDGGLVNPAGVERLVQLMQQDRNDGVRKSADVASRRTLLASVVAATEREDCLSRFVQQGGLSMLDDWLQEAHKGKVGDGGSPKEGDKGVEELLLTLLKALDKLPVDLDALKTCCVGKSVNHLRSHKNLEIHKKARKLVEIWKKRVDAEMKLSGENKSASNHAIWSSYKQNSPDMLHSHLMKTGGPTEVAVKSSGAFAGSAKLMPNGTSTAEGIPKAASVSGGKISTMLASTSPSVMKREDTNGNSKLSTSTLTADSPLSVKEEKSIGSSGQSQSNGQTWGNGKGGAGSTWKEDVKNVSMGGSISSKPTGTGSRHPSLPGKGLLGSNLSGSSKEVLSGKPLVWSRSASSDKLGASSPASSDKGSTEVGREIPNPQHRLIVRIPNPGRSPARMNGASFDQVQPGTRGLSTYVPERNSSASLDTSDVKSRVQNGNQAAATATATTSPDSDVKSGGAGRTVPGVEDERDKFGSSVLVDGLVEAEKRVEDSSMRVEPERNVKESNEQNVLVNGFTQRNGPAEGAMVPEDDKKTDMGAGGLAVSMDGVGSDATSMEVDEVGISLLASVAASEIRTGASVPSHERSQPDDVSGEQGRPSRVSSDTAALHLKDASANQQAVKEGGDGKDQMDCKVTQDSMGSTLSTMKGREEVTAEHVGEGNPGKPGDADSKKEGPQQRQLLSGEGDTKDCEKRHFGSQEASQLLEKSGGSGVVKSCLDRKGDERHINETEKELAALPTGSGLPFGKDLKGSAGGSVTECSIVSPDGHNASKAIMKESQDDRKIQVQGKGVEFCNGFGSIPANELKNSHTIGAGEGASERLERGISGRSSLPREVEIDPSKSIGCAGDRKGPVSVSEAVEAALDGAQELKRRAMDLQTLGRVPSFHSSQMLGIPNLASSNVGAVSSQHIKPPPRTLPAGEPTTPEQATETGPSDGVVGGSDVSERPDFDLNEGFSVEESPQDDSTTSPIAPAPVLAAAAVPPTSSLLAVPIAIVTATKGGFVLPASPMRTKSELGWKGSAATSAFRPAEPRRTPDRQQSNGDTLVPEVSSTGSTAKKVRPPLDLNIDLNVVDDRNLEEIGIASSMSSQGSAVGMSAQVPTPPVSVAGVTFHSDYANSGQLPQHVGNSGRPFLDLNMLDESEESGTLLDADVRVPQAMAPSARSNNGPSLQATRRVSVIRDFDLNDGPLVDDLVADDQPVVQPLNSRNTGSSITSTEQGLRRGPEVVNNTSWFSPNNSFKAVIPDFSSSRAESPYSVAAAAAAQSYLSAGAGGAPFSSDLYRASVTLSSAPPPTAFASGTQGPYSYGGFPVPSGFPYTPGATFTPSNIAPYLDSSVSVNFPIASSGTVTHLTRPPPYLMGLSETGPPEIGNNGWSARPSLDLNSGPEAAEGEGLREDGMSTRPSSMLGGPPSLDQMRVFRQVVNATGPGGGPPLKRKEPESGWEMNRNSGFKQQAWR